MPFSPRNLISEAPAIFVLAVAVGLFQQFHPSAFGFGAGWETVAIAKELVHSGVYGNPFPGGTLRSNRYRNRSRSSRCIWRR